MTTSAPQQAHEPLHHVLARKGQQTPEPGHWPDNDIRTATVTVLNTHDPDPVVALSYTCDFRTEEETGTDALRRAFLNAAADNSFPAQFREGPRTGTQTAHVTEHDDYVIFHTTYAPMSRLDAAITYITQNEPHAQGKLDRWQLDRKYVPELRDMATEAGLPVPSRARKADLVDLILDASPATTPFQHAAWFHDGDALVVRRDDTAYGSTINHLVAAAHAGTLQVGGLGQSSFGTGLTLFDSRDLGPLTRDQVVEDHLLYLIRMDALEPVAAELKARGHHWFFLGKPRVITPKGKTEPDLHFWLNGCAGRGYPQPFGWYTLDELLEEKFIPDAVARQQSYAANVH